MKKILVLALSIFLVVSLLGAVSATVSNTVVAGKIYDSPNFETANGVSGATVHVTCKGIEKTTVSLSDGTYSVIFSPYEFPAGSGFCIDTTASAWAEKDGFTSSTQTGAIQDYTGSLNLYLGIINIALIPEFGVVVGVLTMLGAAGIFMLVRRR